MSPLLVIFVLAQVTKDCRKPFDAGFEQYRRKELAQALIGFRAAVQCDPKLVPAHLAIANIYAERGNEGEALAALLQALEIEPRNVMALRAASNLYLKNGLHTQALPLLETLVTAAPQSVDAHSDLASVFAASGDRAKAEKGFRQAIAIQPDYFPAIAGLGNLLARAGDNDQALPMLRQATQLRPKAYEGHFLLGSALNRLGQFEEAQTELELASKLGGANEPQVYYQLARAWGGLGKAPERKAALATFSELTKKEKDDAEKERRAAAWINEARSMLQSGNLDGAVKQLELAREARPGDATLLFRLAGLNFDLQRYDVAREYAQAALSISPATWLYHYLLGLIEQSTNRIADAKASLTVATQLQPGEAPVWNALGEVLLAEGDRPAAISAFERATKLAPAEAAYRQNLDAARR
jgi:protein O-GlcNAc transferase